MSDLRHAVEDGRLRRAWWQVNGWRIHGLVSAMRPAADLPVVLVHGLGLSGRYMVPAAAALASSHPVLVPDLPGFGDSSKPRAALDIVGLADALAAWMVVAGIAPAALLGNSFGCQIIVELAARHPALVAGAVLQGPTTPPAERTWFRQFVRWRQNAPYNPPSLGPVTWSDYRKCGYRRLLVTFQCALRHAVEARLPAVTAPVLVVRGQRDPICRQDWAEQVAAAAPHGRLVLIPGVAHTLVWTAPQELAAVSRAFLAELEPLAQKIE